VIDLNGPHQPQICIIGLIALSFCIRYTSLKFVSDADEVAVSNFNRWFHDNYVRHDYNLI
jgi:hypothetical protein